MSVKSFECAIARSQIGRYLAGDALGEESMRQLEAHISTCADCQRLIDSKKAELLGPLAHAPTAEEAIASSVAASSIAAQIGTSAIERELREVAMDARAVVGVPTAIAVGAGAPVASAVGASNSDPNPISSAGVPPTSHAFPSTTAPSSGSTPPPTARAKGGFGSAFAKLPLPKLVRDVPDEDSDASAPQAKSAQRAVEPTAETAAVPVAAKKPLGKAAVYGVALLIVLGAMAYIGDPTSLLGGKAGAAEPTAKMSGKGAAEKAAPSKNPKLAVATGVRRSALGVPITDATEKAIGTKSADTTEAGTKARTESAVKEPAAKEPSAKESKPEKTLVAHAATKADPADLGPLEFDPAMDAPAAKSVHQTEAPKHAPVKPAPAKRTRTATAPVKRAAVKKAPIAAEPIHVTPAAAAPTARTKPAPKPATATAKRLAPRKVKRVRKAAPRPASKNTGVIRVYDETGKPLN